MGITAYSNYGRSDLAWPIAIAVLPLGLAVGEEECFDVRLRRGKIKKAQNSAYRFRGTWHTQPQISEPTPVLT
jgi:hypothetical protein